MLFRKLKLDWWYGLSEFAIVLLGVLVALAVDNWNDGREDRGLEAQYLAALSNDLARDTAQLAEAIGLPEARARSGHRLLEAVSSGAPFEPDQFLFAVNSTVALTYPAYTRATIDDLRSTGNLQLLRDTELRTLIAGYYARIEYFEQWRINWRTIQIGMEQTLPDLLTLRQRQTMMGTLGGFAQPPWADLDYQPTAADAADVLGRLAAHPSAVGQIENMTRIQGNHYRNLIEIRDLAVQLLQAVS